MSGLDQWAAALSGFLAQRIPGFDPAAGTLTLPLWAGWAIGALLLGCLLLVFFRARQDGSAGTVARLVLVLVGAAAAWAVTRSGSEAVAERHVLVARAAELATRGAAPGSALACLDESAGETVETSCERALFATPESTAAAVSYVAAQLALLADISDYARRGDASLDPILTNLRHGVERDRFGIVAHLLALREGCAPDQCRAFALLHDSSRVNSNLTERTYDFYVMRHAGGWPAIANPAMAVASPPQTAPGAAAPTVAARTPPSALYFPSASSIPPVNIMNAEPAPPSQAAAAGGPAAKPPTPPRRPAAASQQAKKPANPPRRAPPPAEPEESANQD